MLSPLWAGRGVPSFTERDGSTAFRISTVTGTGSIGGGAIIGMGYVYHDLTALTTAHGTFRSFVSAERLDLNDRFVLCLS
jgi:hypothetical protein